MFGALMAVVAPAWAEEGRGFTRAQWDDIMRWVNLLILVFLIVKYARRPLIGFLSSKKQEVSQLIARYDAQKRQAEAKILEAQTMLAASKERLTLIKERIVEEGRKRQAEIIEAADKDARMMLDAARHKAAGHLRDAVQRLKSELVDEAAREAMTRIVRRVTDDDQERLIDQWLTAVEHWNGEASR
jgi:F-type H+-transporting ATPase subunit b